MKVEIIKAYEKTDDSISQDYFINGVLQIEVPPKEGILIRNALNRTNNQQGFSLTIKRYQSPIPFTPDFSKPSLYLFIFGQHCNYFKIMNYSSSVKTLSFLLNPLTDSDSFDIMSDVMIYYKRIQK